VKYLMVFALMCGLGLLAIAEAKEVPAPVVPPRPEVVAPAPVVPPRPAVVAPVVPDIRISGEVRMRHLNWGNMLFPAPTAIVDEDWTETRTRLLVRAGLVEGVSATFRLVNDRRWGVTAAPALDVRLDRAFLTITDIGGSAADLTIGRQGIVLADRMLIAAGFDAIRLSVPFDPVVVDVFSAKIFDAVPGTLLPADEDLMGLHVVYRHPSPAITANMGYYEWVRRGAVPKETVNSIAIGGSGSLGILGLSVDGGIIHQTGSIGPLSIDANAFYGGVAALTPMGRVRLSYTSLSGDANPLDATDHSFRPMFEDVKFGEIIEEIPGLRTNIDVLGLSFETMPIPDVGVRVGYVDIRRDKVGAGVNKKIGTELNIGATYDLTKNVELGFLIARFSPGRWWTTAVPAVPVPMTRTATLMGVQAEVKF